MRNEAPAAAAPLATTGTVPTSFGRLVAHAVGTPAGCGALLPQCTMESRRKWDDRPASTPLYALPSGDTEHNRKGNVAAQVGCVSQRAVDLAGDNPAPHEVAGSPVRSLKDLEENGSPGTSNEATKRLPP
jgi:hypothetical protein